MKNVPEKYKQGQDWSDANFITAIEVEERYGVSRQQQRNLYMKGVPPDALYIGATLLYFRITAEPFFRDYDKRQKDRIANSEERKDKRRPGRPKKPTAAEEWRHTTFRGWTIDIPEEFASPKAWVDHVHKKQMKIYAFPPHFQSPEHLAWVDTWMGLKAHFGIQEKRPK